MTDDSLQVQTNNDAPQKAQDNTHFIVVDDEIIRQRVRNHIGQRNCPASGLAGVLKHPLVSVTWAFILTGVLGASLTYFYSLRQMAVVHANTISEQDAAHARAFALELARTRASKIGEVWESAYLYEAAFLETKDKLRHAPFPPMYPQGAVHRSRSSWAMQTDEEKNSEGDRRETTLKLYKKRVQNYQEFILAALTPSRKRESEFRNLLNRNRFWMGERSFLELSGYVDAARDYIEEFVEAGKRGENGLSEAEGRLAELETRREQHRKSIVEIRDRLLSE